MDTLIRGGESVVPINEDLSIIQKDNGLKFGTDSYLLSAFIKKNLRGRACDLGAGCGVISLFAAARTSLSEIHALEIQQEFAKLISRNAALNKLDGKITSVCADVRLVGELYGKESFGAVFSNPPYMKRGSGKENVSSEMNTARREINGTLADFVRAASYLLKFGGLFYVVYRPERSAELINSLCENLLEPKRLVTVYPDASSAPCLILIEAKKGAAPSLDMSCPLIIYGEDRKYTKDMQRVYDEFSLEHLFKK